MYRCIIEVRVRVRQRERERLKREVEITGLTIMKPLLERKDVIQFLFD